MVGGGGGGGGGVEPEQFTQGSHSRDKQPLKLTFITMVNLSLCPIDLNLHLSHCPREGVEKT